MKQITARLAQAQLTQNKKRTVVTIIGIVLSVAMLTAVFGFAMSGIETMRRLVGDENIADYRNTLYALAGVLGAIIMAASVVVISNAFRISAAERTRQFGILKSVGATGRQILKSVLYEAVFLSAVSIPAGVAVGFLLQWLGASIGDFFLSPMNKLINNGLTVSMQFVFSFPVIGASVAVSLATVMLSAFLPARKAARMPAIEAIRLTQEIKLRKNKLRTAKVVNALFGFEGTLAAKAIKRSRRSYRAMVAALAISIVLFLVCSSLDTMFTMTMNQAYNNINANTLITYTADASGADASGADASRRPLDAAAAQRVTEALKQYPDAAIYGVGVNDAYTAAVRDTALTGDLLRTLLPDQESVGVALVTADAAHYEALCSLAGVPIGSNILINSTQKNVNGRTTELVPLRYSGQTLRLYNNGEETNVTLHGQLSGAQVPQELAFTAEEDIIILVPDCPARAYLWFGLSADSQGFIVYAEDTLQTFFPAESAQERAAFSVTDVTAITEMTRSLTKLITVFLYGFVGMLTLIGLTSVISAISANVRLRAREFAVLVSAGMTQGGVRRMLALESVMSALKALLYGIPLGAVCTYLVFLALTGDVKFAFSFPWATLPEAVAGVFLVTLITTQYAAAKLRGGSVMDAIRANEGL